MSCTLATPSAEAAPTIAASANASTRSLLPSWASSDSICGGSALVVSCGVSIRMLALYWKCGRRLDCRGLLRSSARHSLGRIGHGLNVNPDCLIGHHHGADFSSLKCGRAPGAADII